MERGKAAHGEDDHVGRSDPKMVEHGLDVRADPGLGVHGTVLGHVRGRVAAGVVGDAAIAPREGADLGFPAAAVAGEFGDGLMPYLTPLSHLPTLNDAANNARVDAGHDTQGFGCILSIPTFVSDDEAAARSAARYNLAFFAQLPNYRRQWRRAGFKTAMDSLQEILKTGTRKEAAKQIPDELIDEVCVFGTPTRCRQQLQAFRDAGVDEPLLAVSPINEDRLVATRKAITALAPG